VLVLWTHDQDFVGELLAVNIRFCMGVCALATVLGLSTAQAQISHEPTGAFIGAGVSAGAARISAPGEQTTVGMTSRARLGMMLTPLFGFDLEGSVNFGGQRNLLIGSLGSGITYFLTEGGFFTRGGIGVMHLTKAIANGRQDTGAALDATVGFRFLLNHERTASLEARIQHGFMELDNVTIAGLGIATSWF